MPNYYIDDKWCYIYSIKCFAIISVICAHIANVNPQYSYSNILVGNALKSLGAIGVSVFFVLSGYLFSNTKRDFITFFKKKFFTIVIPWFFTGSLVYLYVAVRKTNIDIKQWCYYVLGNGSYLYYLLMLMVCYIVFWLCKNKLLQIVLMILSVVSIILTSLGNLANINPFINPFNWFLYFQVGMFLQNQNYFAKLITLSREYLLIWIALFFLIIGYVTFKNEYLSYWSLYYIPVEFLALMIIFGIGTYQWVHENVSIRYIGQFSFSIYLLHMPVAGIITNLFDRVDLVGLTILRPFVVILITIIFVYIYSKISEQKKIPNMLIGIR
jgi:peptidoglycan/LPS O-acetylase OafA/YrhL